MGHVFPKGNPGRPKGSKNHWPVGVPPIREMAVQVLYGGDPAEYIRNVHKRILEGNAPHAERFFLEHLWGKPKETIDLNITQQTVAALLVMDDMRLMEFLERLQAGKQDEALKLLPGSAEPGSAA